MTYRRALDAHQPAACAVRRVSCTGTAAKTGGRGRTAHGLEGGRPPLQASTTWLSSFDETANDALAALAHYTACLQLPALCKPLWRPWVVKMAGGRAASRWCVAK